jgi:hypothetical protein
MHVKRIKESAWRFPCCRRSLLHGPPLLFAADPHHNRQGQRELPSAFQGAPDVSNEDAGLLESARRLAGGADWFFSTGENHYSARFQGE